MLSDRHAAFLAARAVTGPVIERRGYATITDWRDLAAAGYPPELARKLVPVLLIPRYGLGGHPSAPQCRPDVEGRNGPMVNRDGRPMKYLAPPGSWNSLDCLAGTALADDIWVSAEGPIKADAMVAASGLAVVSFNGVYGWRSQGETILGLEVLARRRPWFHVVCDSDIATNPRVAGAMFRLAATLRRGGCKVRILHPPGENKVGVDDFLAGGGRIGQLVEEQRPTLTVRRAWACRRLATWGAT